MELVIWFFVSFILVFLLYYFFSIRKSRRNGKIPTEANLLIKSNNLDINKFSYRKFMIIVGLCVSLDVSIVFTIVSIVKGLIWQILFGFVAVVPIMLLTFIPLGKYYNKKQLKDNTKELEKEKQYLDKLDAKKNKKKLKREEKKGRKKENHKRKVISKGEDKNVK